MFGFCFCVPSTHFWDACVTDLINGVHDIIISVCDVFRTSDITFMTLIFSAEIFSKRNSGIALFKIESKIEFVLWTALF